VQNFNRPVGATLLAALLTACSSSGESSVSALPTLASPVSGLSSAATAAADDMQRALQMSDPDAGTHAGKLYVANFSGRNILVFDIAHGNAPLSPITGGGMTNPNNAALDSAGNLYVPNGGPSNIGSHTVSVFNTLQNNAPLVPITVGKAGPPQVPVAVAVAAGKMYLANTGADGFGTHRLMVYSTAAGHARLPDVTGPDIHGPFGLIVDSSGRLYVANKIAGSVDVFDTLDGNAPLHEITGSGLNQPDGLTISTDGLLYVANAGSNSVKVFDTKNGYALVSTITGGGLTAPSGIAIDAGGALFVANTSTNTISIFDTKNGNAPLPAITGNGLNFPDGLAVR
jgi:YVTN family beta-propeller protein